MTSEPLKINGVETSLEYEGETGNKQYYIPLRSASGNLPVLLEVNYRIQNSGGKIPILGFDKQTAVHDCYLFLQIPEDSELIGYSGDWDDYLPGSWIDSLVATAVAAGMGDSTPRPDSNQIIQDMQTRAGCEIVVQNPLIGEPIPFTSLDPQKPLTVRTIAGRWLHLCVFILLGVFAVAGIRQKLGHQLVMLIILMAVSIAIGIVLPLLSATAFGAEAAVTVLGIAVTWITLDAAQLLRKKPFTIFSKIFASKKDPGNLDESTGAEEEIAPQPAEEADTPPEDDETAPTETESSDATGHDDDQPPADDSSQEGQA